MRKLKIKEAKEVKSLNLIFEYYTMPPMDLPQTHAVLAQKTVKALLSEEVSQIIDNILHAFHIANTAMARELTSSNLKAQRRYRKLRQKSIFYLGEWAKKSKELQLES